MPQLPFAGLPSAPPPGSSYFISNALIVAKRVALGLEDPVRIQAGKWGEGHPVVDWSLRHRGAKIQCMQLRKEKKHPFFHEYISFRLDDGGCFRLDRRQLPAEQSPLDCAEPSGVAAYDTIEQIASLDDSMYNKSDCLAVTGARTKTEVHPILQDRSTNLNQESTLPTEGATTAWGVAPRFIQSSPSDAMQGSTIGDLQAYLYSMIHAYSARVGQYMFLLGCSAEVVERDIKMAMNKVWHQAWDQAWDQVPALSEHFLATKLSIQPFTPRPESQVRIQFNQNRDPSTSLLHWRQHHESKIIVTMQLRREQKAPFHEYVAFKLKNGSCFRVDRRWLSGEQSLLACTNDKGPEAYDSIEQIATLEDSTYDISDCLIQFDFSKFVDLDFLFDVFRAIASHKQAAVYTIRRFNCYFYAHTIILCTIHCAYGFWCDVWQSQPQHSLGSSSSHAVPHPRHSAEVKRTRPEFEMEESSFWDVQLVLSDLICTHGVRVEESKFTVGGSAKDLERSVKEAMNDIWRDVRRRVIRPSGRYQH
ncbi:unnamed protein product [Rhizoctonia solani]|uniref:Uncharacterized protein n=1 Tax=Rhizoctonia solani TaxID=456999 RepID=A0A8H3D645_9AGAM|nr:unnamed protein product [Rhizoctonia solani]